MPATATPDRALRDRLKSVREAITEKRDDRAEAVKTRDAAKAAFASADFTDKKITEVTEFKDAEQAVAALGEIDDAIEDLKLAEKGVLAMLGDSAPAPDARSGNGPTNTPRGAEGGWDIDRVLQGDSYQQFIAEGTYSSKAKFGARHLGQLASREATAKMFAAVIGDEDMQNAIPADRRGIIPPNLKRLTLLDLVPTGTTDSNLVEYVQILAIPEQAAETAPGELKPEAAFTTQDADAPVRTIAGWLKVKKQALADVAGLRTLLGTLLPYDVRRRIESQMLVGTGSGENLTGLLNTDGIHDDIPAVDGDNYADAILRAITMIVLSDGDPNFAAINPLGWQELLLMREDQANRTGAYLYGSPSAAAAPTIWGLALTANRVVPLDAPLVGDSMSLSLLVREGVNLLVSDSDQDDFVRNRATLLAEARVAMPVWKPTNFAIAPVPASGS